GHQASMIHAAIAAWLELRLRIIVIQMHTSSEPDTPPTPPAGGGAAAPALQVEDLHVRYDTPEGRLEVLRGLTFQLQHGEIGCLLGPSGCGKTTALRAIAGFIRPSGGRIFIDGTTVSNPRQCTEPESRGVGVVFQDYALFPHLDVAANIAFGLRQLAPAARRPRVLEMLALVGLPEIGERYPHELSGGQQQRVALARALAPAPSILLLDEPFSNLDPDLRERLALDLRETLERART